MPITYRINVALNTLEVIAVYNSAGLNRPTNDVDRINEMYRHSNLVISAWDGDTLVGVARSLTDFAYCCYLSDLAVRKEYQHLGIGKELIRFTHEAIGDRSMLLLLSAPRAMEYYPKVGFDKVENGFMIKRTA